VNKSAIPSGRNAGRSILFTPFAILPSFSFAGLARPFFGFYPTHKASFLNPIDALMHEAKSAGKNRIKAGRTEP